MRIAALAALTMLLAGCAGSGETGPGAALSGSGVTGDQRGGKMHYGPGGLSGAMNAATAHCRQFGKNAQITQMAPAPDGSGELGFECRGGAS
jgi:hypothetical protein